MTCFGLTTSAYRGVAPGYIDFAPLGLKTESCLGTFPYQPEFTQNNLSLGRLSETTLSDIALEWDDEKKEFIRYSGEDAREWIKEHWPTAKV